MGKPKKHQKRMAFEILIAQCPPVLIDELERAADGGDLLGDRRRNPTAHHQNNPEAQEEAGQKCGADHQNANAARGHGLSSIPSYIF
jgi:hypothetical protein